MTNPTWLGLDLLEKMASQNGCEPWEILGLVPSFLDEDAPGTAAEQFNRNYVGGWHPQSKVTVNPDTLEMFYPGDPAFKPLAFCLFRDEVVVFFEHEYVGIYNPETNAFEAMRMD